MIVVLQRVSRASVSIDGRISGSIERGALIFVGIEEADDPEDIEWLTRKIANLRIFNDSEEKMNLSCGDIMGGFLVISQFTLHASTKKGNRPSYIKAAKPDIAVPLYERFLEMLSDVSGLPVESGEFGADMQVSLINDGPVTIIIDSKDRK